METTNVTKATGNWPKGNGGGFKEFCIVVGVVFAIKFAFKSDDFRKFLNLPPLPNVSSFEAANNSPIDRHLAEFWQEFK